MNVQVASPQGGYQVHIGSGALAELPSYLAGAERVALICSAPLADLAPRVEALLEGRAITRILVPDAEAAKTPQVLADCWNQLAEAGFTRSDVVLGLGGGSATDLAGFVAASWLRGVRYIAIPTSVLGMVDAAVGGKTGINLAAGKNLVGAFYEPQAVLADLSLLTQLPAAEVSSGLAEVIKCGFIADQRILELAQADLGAASDVSSEVFAELVSRAVKVKADVVAADFKERTSSANQVGREALNYGHTLGHAIEAYEGFKLRHGQAISIGMVWLAEVSRQLLGLADTTAALHRELLAGLGLPVSYDADAWPKLRELMNLDKKTRGTSLRLVGLSAQGSPTILQAPSEDVLTQCYAAVVAAN